jgi:hypothetical protein
MRKIYGFEKKQSDLPHSKNKHVITEDIFWRKNYFHKRLGPQGPLTPLCPHSFLMGHIKGCVYDSNLHSIAELKTNIKNAISDINHNIHWLAHNMVK